MPRRPDNPSGRPHLHDVLIELCRSETKRRMPLSGGAWIEWEPATRTFKAERLNRLIKDPECADFERFLRRAGLRFGERTRSVLQADAQDINTWFVVAWVIAQPPAAPAPSEHAEQGSLFHLPGEA
jgi:hypothetical protein